MMPLFIAEVSSNHHRELSRCIEFIDQAAAIGCGAVKFQLFRVKELFAPEVLIASEQHRQREAWELPEPFLPELAARCRQKNIKFSCTPFYMDAVNALEPHVDFYKVASYELMWDELLQACAKTGKPIVLSTGMATLNEVQHAVSTLRDAGCRELTLLHCVSGYPTPVDQTNLAAIQTLRETCHCDVGWSDHSVQPGVIHRAVNRWQASMIEFHLDLEGEGEEYSAGHCWLPNEIDRLITDVKAALMADGSGEKQPVACETADRDWRADPVDGLRPLQKIRAGFGA